MFHWLDRHFIGARELRGRLDHLQALISARTRTILGAVEMTDATVKDISADLDAIKTAVEGILAADVTLKQQVAQLLANAGTNLALQGDINEAFAKAESVKTELFAALNPPAPVVTSPAPAATPPVEPAPVVTPAVDSTPAATTADAPPTTTEATAPATA